MMKRVLFVVVGTGDGERTEVTDDTTVEFIAMECVEPNRGRARSKVDPASL